MREMLSLPSFLKQVDRCTAAMDREQMAALLLDIARKVPEGRREDYLTRLARFGPEAESLPEQPAKPEEDLREVCQRILEGLSLIQEGELCLEEAEPDYDDYDYDYDYYSDDEEIQYEDPDGLLDILDQACAFVHKCLDLEEYQLGYRVAEQVSVTQVGTDVDELTISEIFALNLCARSFQSFALDALYLAYLANNLERRAWAWNSLYQSLSLDERYTISLVEQERGPLPDLPDFLPHWISCQGIQTGKQSQFLLREALLRKGDPACFLGAARSYSRQHPELYLQYLSDHEADLPAKRQYQIGREALERLDLTCPTRGLIAEHMARKAQEMGRDEDAGTCWLEAYRSNPSLANLLRLGTEGGAEYYRSQEVASILQAARSELGEDSFLLESMLTGDVSLVVQQVKKPAKQSMFHSYREEFPGCSLAAMILLLDRGDTLRSGIRDMCSRIQIAARFRAEDYNNGLSAPRDEDDLNLLWTCLYQWRSTLSVPEDRYDQLYHWLEEVIRRKTETVVGGQIRDNYSVCADHIAALGDAAQSRGLGRKQDLLESCAQRYPRHRSFLECLSRHGYKKPGKGR